VTVRAAFVTGGTSGIGRATVAQLAEDGWRVAFTGRDSDRGAAVSAATGAAFISADARDRGACDAALGNALAFLDGRVDLMVLGAAVVYAGPLETTPEPVLHELFEVNLTSTFRYSRAGLSLMREQGGGVIVHIVSDAAIHGIHHLAGYTVTKAAVHTMSELFAADGAPFGVRVNAICPGATYPGVQSTVAGHEHHREDASKWAAPVSGRHGRGEDIAHVVTWLASDEAEHVSGATIRVDGAASAAMRQVALA
jgi:NAD(P)-dependent dehydrogenase (short-subunit alcohol dehydrogenase family)